MKRQVQKGTVELSKWAERYIERFDAADCWQTPLLPGDSDDSTAWLTAVTTRSPKWVKTLMTIRDTLMRPFGLKTSTESTAGAPLFPVLDSTPNETIAGVEDSHLTFWVIATTSQQMVSLTTYVRIHNLLGKLYWAVIQHFHPRIIKASMTQASVPQQTQ